ncbi:MAG: hypothetical protein V1867_04140 [Candidatus Falkowbacteria bacterium]
MNAVLGSLPLFYLSALCVAGGVLGIMSMKKAQRERHPFAAISFGFGVPALFLCLVMAVFFGWIGIRILQQ